MEDTEYMYTLYKEYNGARYFADVSEGLRKSMHQAIRRLLMFFKEIMRLKEDEQEENGYEI